MLTDRDRDILEFIQKYGGITIHQAYKIFFSKAKYGNDLARKRLKKLYDKGIIKCKDNWLTNEKIYTLGKELSGHDLKLLDLFSELIYQGAEILEFKKEIKFMDGKIRSDGLIHFGYKEIERVLLVEIDFTHQTDISKYELLFHSSELQDVYGVFPLIVIVTDHKREYNGNDFLVEFLDFNLSNVKYKVLL